jgi:nicotinate-nucleotide--dimethylbenzimidazole phosphoribosyltransferase
MTVTFAAVEFPPITPPDDESRGAALARCQQLIKPVGSLGRLEELGAWVAACQQANPPRVFQRPRVVVFAGDHGVAAKGVSAYPAEVTAQMVTALTRGVTAANVLAAAVGASVRVIDMAVDADTGETAGRHKVRRGSGVIDIEDALTDDETVAAVNAGRAVADEEVDGGADLLVAGDLGIGNTTPAAVIASAFIGIEPVAVVGRGSGIDDAGWMRKVTVIRDALRRARRVMPDPLALLRTVGGADFAAMAGFLAQAAVRRTPVLLDGLAIGAAALVAEEFTPGARQWWAAGHAADEPAHGLVLEHLGLAPLLNLGMRLGEGTGALAALPLVQAAARLLAEMATFEQAGVTGKAG